MFAPLRFEKNASLGLCCALTLYGDDDLSTYREFRAETRKRRRKRSLQRVGFVLLIALLLMGLAWFIVQLIEGPKPKPAPSSSAATSQPAGIQSTSQPGVIATPAPSITPADQETVWDKYAQAERSINTFGVSGTDPRMIALPQNGRIDLSFFTDAVFFGDSITQGWKVYNSGLPNPNVVAEISVGLPTNGAMWARDRSKTDFYDPMAELVARAPKKVYMMFGTNTLVNGAEGVEDRFISDYATVIDQLRAALPGTDIYIQSLLTPTEKGQQKNPNLNPERIARVNSRLAALAVEKGCYYLNISEVLCRDGRLNWDIAAGDGTHMNADGYRGWLEYLVTHTAYRTDSTYVGGSPFALLSTETPAVAVPVPETAPAADPNAAAVDPNAAPAADPNAAAETPAA